MLIVGPDWSVVAHMRADGVIAQVDRAMKYLAGRRLADVVDLARRRNWEIHFGAHEKAQLAAMNLPPVDVVQP
jgi:hypothetical protein